jgi:hypothetical protein
MMARILVLLTLLQLISLQAFACTNELQLVCGYWTHTAKTATFQNECKMREQGAQLRHTGACADTFTKKSTQSGSTKTTK